MLGLKSYFIFSLKQHFDFLDRLETVRISPVGYLCNHSCPMCWRNQTDFKTKKKSFSALEKKSLTLRDYKNLIATFPKSVKNIDIVGGGEPLLYPKFGDLIELIKKRGLKGRLITNGIFLHDVSSVLIKNNWETVRISFHAATKNVYKEIHGQDDYEKVISNIKNLIRLRGTSVFPKISLLFVIQKNNAHQVCNFFDLAESLKVDEVEYDYVVQDIPLILNITKAQKNDVILGLEKYKHKKRITHNIEYVLENFKLHPNWNPQDRYSRDYFKFRFCSNIENNLDINSTGRALPCCFACYDKKFNRNIKNESLAMIWDAYSPFRKDLHQGKFRYFCTKYCNYRLSEYPGLIKKA